MFTGDENSPPPASQAQGTLAQLQILAKTHPEILNDPTIRAAMNNPAQLQTALQAWQHSNGMDPNGVYDNSGTLQNSSWFSDNLPWITAAMGAGLGGAGLLAGGGAGAGAGAAELGPATSANMAATSAASAAPVGIAAGGAAAAAPTVGGFFQSLGKLGGSLGQIGGASAAAAGQGRAQQAGIQQAQDRNALTAYNDQFQNNLRAPSTLASQAARGDILANVQPAQFNNLPSWISNQMPQMSGGATPAALGPNARNAGAALSRNALLRLGSSNFNLPQPPSLTPLPTPTAMDQVNQGIGQYGSYLGAAGDLYKLFGGG